MIDFKLKNKWDIPSQSLPIIFIGAGGIIRNAHIPAYKKLNLNIAGVYDLNPETAKTLAKDFNIPDVYNNLGSAYYLEGHYNNAYEVLKKSIELNPYYDDAIFNLLDIN